MQMNNLADLPLNILSNILNRLPLDDKLRCRKVSKLFLYLIDNQNQKSVVVTSNRDFVYFKWFNDYKMVDFRNLILCQPYYGLNSNPFENRFFRNLKKFYINCDGFSGNKRLKSLDFLNNFNKLETLKIAIMNRGLNTKLRLNELKNVDIYLNSESRMYINSPKLEYLIASDFGNLQFKHSHSIKRVQTIRYCQSNFDFIKKFENLHQFNIDYIGKIDPLTELVKELTKLKVLCIKIESKKELDFSRLKSYTDSKSIKVYVNGLLIKYWDKLKTTKEYDLLDGDNLPIYLDDCSALYKDLSIISTVHYNSLESFGNVSCVLEDKLVNLRRIIVDSKVTNEDKLVNFLIKCERVNKLQLINSSLTQQFYSNLHSYLLIVRDLIIQDDSDLMKKLNFRFLLGLKELKTLKISQNLDLPFVKELFMTLNYFSKIKFLFDGEYVCILPAEAYGSKIFKRTDNEQLCRFAIDLTKEYNRKYSLDKSTPFEFMIGNFDWNYRALF